MKQYEYEHQVLKITKGTELQVYGSGDVHESSAYMHQSYRQAMSAVAGIVERSHRFRQTIRGRHNQRDKLIEQQLFSYGSNVVAFAAQRGAGKTHMMLSFARSLSDQGRLDKRSPVNIDGAFVERDWSLLGDVRFFVLPPISPSSIGVDQNLLYIILTRLYRYAQELLDGKVAFHASNDFGQSVYGGTSAKDVQWRNELHMAFQRCQSGIIGAKRKTENMSEDLMELQEIGDGLVLCRLFFELVDKIVSYIGGENSYLVLQLDDADSQIKDGYRVLEDVRKYLQIPNLIILMSADMEMIHASICQEYQNLFPGRKNDVKFQENLIRMGWKHIDKLIPPTHMINLPQVDMIIEQYARQLRLRYQDESGNNVFPWAETMDLQDMILHAIYRKTGIVFVRPTAYPHNILPTTMRGLNQLLHLLSQMTDIPFVEEKVEGIENVASFVRAVQEQTTIQADNLSRFSDYFAKGWMRVKVTNQEDLDFLIELSNAVSARYIPMTVDYLCKKYHCEKPPHHKEQLYLDDLMLKISQTRNSQSDYYLLFAIRTLFTLNHHRMALRQKYKALADYKALPKDTHRSFFLIDYDPRETYLPKSYLVNENVRSFPLIEEDAVIEAQKIWSEYEAQHQKVISCTEACRQAEEACIVKKAQLEQAETILLSVKQEAEDALSLYEQVQAQNDMTTKLLDSEKSVTERLRLLDSEKQVLDAKFNHKAKEKMVKAAEEQYNNAKSALQDAEQAVQNAQTDFQAAEQDFKNAHNAVKDYNIQKDNFNKEKPNRTVRLRITDDLLEKPKTVYSVFKVRQALLGIREQNNTKEENQSALKGKMMLRQTMVCKDENGQQTVNFMNFITFLLRLGADGVVAEDQGNNVDKLELQRMLYLTQSCALTIATNWDVQDYLYKKLFLDSARKTVSFKDLYSEVDRVMQTINSGESFKAYRAIHSQAAYRDAPPAWSIGCGFTAFSADGKYTMLSSGERCYTFYEIFGLEYLDEHGVSNTPPELKNESGSVTTDQ